MVSTQTITAVYAKLVNRPGELERAARAVGDARVNVDAVSLETVGSTGFARFYTREPRLVAEQLRAIGIEAFESPSIVAALVNRPGELARAASELAAAGINVESVACTADGHVVFRTDDNDRAREILRKL